MEIAPIDTENQRASAQKQQELRLNLGKVKVALQKLGGVSSTPSIALSEAAEILSKHLSVSMCSISGFTDHCTTTVLLAAYGRGASALQETPVMHGSEYSHAMLLEQPLCLHYKVEGRDQASTLPVDLRPLVAAGLRSFLIIPIAAEDEVVGSLLIANEDVAGFDVDWWEPMLGCLSMGLLPHLRSDQTYQMCLLMKQLDTTPDYLMLINQLLNGVHTLLLRAKNVTTGCRFALINPDATKALVFEADRSGGKRPDNSGRSATATKSAAGSAASNVQGDSPVHVTEIRMDNTLLQDAVQKGKARFVPDCASYIQTCMTPATDIFIGGNDMVASIVVLPLVYNSVAFGGLYITLETVSYFQSIRPLLMGLVNSVVLVLHKHLADDRERIWDAVMSKTPDGALTRVDASSDVTNSSGGDSVSARPIVIKRNCTEAMLKVLQHEIRRTTAHSQAHEWVDELVLTEVLGKGGFGIVYKGTWKGSVAAVKVMHARSHVRQAMKDALEMALLTTVSHPFIVQVYSCFTDMVEDAGGAGSVNSNGVQENVSNGINVRFRRLQPDEDPALATCNILVMEYCDRATLRHATKKGVFHKRLDNASVAVDMCAILQVLIEVAQAIQHLHALKLIHCDIKPENVLLKSDSSKPIGFQTKLTDFGLAKILRESYYIVNTSGSGTVTHLAPELFQVGSKLTSAVDAFSFGIMMWEIYTGQRAYSGLGREAIIERVYKKKGRPIFPLGVPPLYATLALACWDGEPRSRPTFFNILAKLSEMLAVFRQSSQPGDADSSAA
ncbi:hypothetical protein FOA52_005113 [Chlamydomonas sp. UWO 241]|nr:hypothetical protein FOA52_005113 [Chlamydomonas sp. UWO 241]